MFEVSSVTARNAHSSVTADLVTDGHINIHFWYEYVTGDGAQFNWVQLELSSPYDINAVEVWLR